MFVQLAALLLFLFVYLTGNFEIDDTILAATDRLFERNPNAQLWGIRIGHRAVYHFGARSLKQNQ